MLAFDINKTVSYWISSAKYDLSVANAMFKSKKYPYALFMGHLALEKLLKALVVAYTTQKLKEMKEVFKWIKTRL